MYVISGMFSIKPLFLCSVDSWKKILCEETPASMLLIQSGLCSLAVAAITAAWSRRELLGDGGQLRAASGNLHSEGNDFL